MLITHMSCPSNAMPCGLFPVGKVPHYRERSASVHHTAHGVDGPQLCRTKIDKVPYEDCLSVVMSATDRSAAAKKAAAERKRTAAANKATATRKANAAAKKRIESAVKAAATRKANAAAKKRSEAAKKANETRKRNAAVKQCRAIKAFTRHLSSFGIRLRI
jgi:hypothetical protein